MFRNLIPSVISPGQSLSSIAISGAPSRLAGVFIGDSFSGGSLTFNTQDLKGNQYVVSDGAGGSYTRTCRKNDYVPIPFDVGAGLDRVLFAANTSQVTNACSLLAVFVDN